MSHISTEKQHPIEWGYGVMSYIVISCRSRIRSANVANVNGIFYNFTVKMWNDEMFFDMWYEQWLNVRTTTYSTDVDGFTWKLKNVIFFLFALLCRRMVFVLACVVKLQIMVGWNKKTREQREKPQKVNEIWWSKAQLTTFFFLSSKVSSKSWNFYFIQFSVKQS